MELSALSDYPQRRYNPLLGSWVLASPHRMKRPWEGKQEESSQEKRPVYDPQCYLCPNNIRASNEQNPDYSQTYVFTNDFAAILPHSPELSYQSGTLIQAKSVRGTCRVICFSPRHDLTLADMDPSEIRAVIDTWADQISELGHEYAWVQVFENKGEMMGCSNPHPHGQIWASDTLPEEPNKEDNQQREYAKANNKSPLLLDYLELELGHSERVVVDNDHWVAVVPFWAVWPFEILLLPRRHVLRLPDLTQNERQGLAQILKRLLTKYDNLFQVSFPYSMGWHGAPTIPGNFDFWQLHAHFYPPLLRSAKVKKFLVGYEMLGEPQRDITAEQAAERLRILSEV